MVFLVSNFCATGEKIRCFSAPKMASVGSWTLKNFRLRRKNYHNVWWFWADFWAASCRNLKGFSKKAEQGFWGTLSAVFWAAPCRNLKGFSKKAEQRFLSTLFAVFLAGFWAAPCRNLKGFSKKSEQSFRSTLSAIFVSRILSSRMQKQKLKAISQKTRAVLGGAAEDNLVTLQQMPSILTFLRRRRNFLRFTGVVFAPQAKKMRFSELTGVVFAPQAKKMISGNLTWFLPF